MKKVISEILLASTASILFSSCSIGINTNSSNIKSVSSNTEYSESSELSDPTANQSEYDDKLSNYKFTYQPVEAISLGETTDNYYITTYEYNDYANNTVLYTEITDSIRSTITGSAPHEEAKNGSPTDKGDKINIYLMKTYDAKTGEYLREELTDFNNSGSSIFLTNDITDEHFEDTRANLSVGSYTNISTLSSNYSENPRSSIKDNSGNVIFDMGPGELFNSGDIYGNYNYNDYESFVKNLFDNGYSQCSHMYADTEFHYYVMNANSNNPIEVGSYYKIKSIDTNENDYRNN